MANQPTKSVFISYSDADIALAVNLREALNALLGDSVWMRDFDLNGGDLVIEGLNDAISEAKWFIILISASSIGSQWLKTEANLATIRAITDMNVRIIILKLDSSDLPKHLEVALATQFTVDLSHYSDKQDGFFQIAEYIDKHISLPTKTEVYVDRGESRDEFSLLSRRNQVIFILGWAGIGKSAFVTESVSQALRKDPLTIKLTRGHSTDLLSRQILQKAHVSQPIGMSSIQDRELLLRAIDALKQRSNRYFLFLDNAEEGVGGANQFLPYLEQFLEMFIDASINTHVILATTRYPDYTPSIAKAADLLRLGKLDDKYIKESIDLWLQGSEKHSQLMRLPEIDDLVGLADGHPLAAKMLSSFMKFRSLDQLLNETERHRFELRLAQYVLRSADHNILNNLHKLILHILATVREPMLLEDMLAVRELRKYSLEDIHKARLELTDLFLIEQNGEFMYLHKFLSAYYKDQLKENEELRGGITSDVGHYAYQKVKEVNNRLHDLVFNEQRLPEDEEVIKTSTNVFRYAVAADRLLRFIGAEHLANNLPIQIKGTLREMVFYFYQEKKDYDKALVYAKKWLALSPNDIEIILQQARCYRSIRNGESLIKADRILSELETQSYNKRFAARVYREKALVAEAKGEIEDAKRFYRQGISFDTSYPYPENYSGLAIILLKEAEGFPFESKQRLRLANEAVELLERARKGQSALFDRFHLGTYAEALFEAGQEDKALPLLLDALDDRPTDERINYRLAEILRKREQFEQAEKYATVAHNAGFNAASLTLANILYSQAMEEISSLVPDNTSKKKLERALEVIGKFKPKYESDKEVSDTIAAKIYRALGLFNKAREVIEKYKDTNNSYTIYEKCKIDLSEATSYAAEEKYGEAFVAVQRAIMRIEKFSKRQSLTLQLKEVLEEAVNLESQIKEITN